MRRGEPEGNETDRAPHDAIAAERIRLLLKNPADVTVNLINGCLVALVAGRLFPGWVVAAWLAVFCIVSLARAMLRRRYAREPTGTTAPARWGYLFTRNALAAGCIWGLTASIVAIAPDSPYCNFILFVLGGTMAGGIVCTAAWLPTMLAFILPVVSPAIVILAIHGGAIDSAMALMLALFTVTCLWVGRSIGQSIMENIRLRVEQEILGARLRSSEAAMAEAQKISHVGTWTLDLKAHTDIWSEEAYRIFGVDPATFTPGFEALLAHVHPDDRELVTADYAEILSTGTSPGMDHRIVMKDGSVRHVHEMTQTTYDSNGKTIRIIGTVQDITERKNAENKLQFANSILTNVLQASVYGILVVDVNRNIILSNRKLGEIWNVPPEELPRLTMETAVAWAARMLADPQQFLARIDPIFDRPGKDSRDQYVLIDGRTVDHDNVMLRGSAGEYLGRVLYFRDVTERKNAENKIQFANIILRNVMEASPYGIMVCDPDRKIILFNQKLGKIWNIPPEELPGLTLETAVAKTVPLLTDPQKTIARFHQIFDRPGDDGHDEFLLTDRRTLARDYATLWGSAGEYLGRVWYFRDITARRNEEEKVAFTDLVLKTQMEASLDGILVVDQTKTIVSFNRRIADIWNIPLADLAAGADDPVLKTVAASVKDPLSFVARVKYLYDHPGEDSQEEVETLDGRSLDRHSVTLWGPLQKYLGRAWFFRDITDRKRSEALELRMARFDVLTGLANRAVFVEALQQSIASAERGETGFAVLYLDLDRFKDVNDTLGHPAGDELLQAVADRLRARTRIADTVARFGGDEFAMIVSGIRDPTDAAILADKLIEALAVPFSIQGSDIHSGASIGIAAYGLDTTDAETLLSHADLALYRAKAEGRGGYRFFTGAMDTEAHTRVTLGAELRVAIDAGQLFLLYQPQVEIASGRITGLEALVRWRHPTRGILAPCLFVPVAEQMGIIAKLGHWVLLEACRQGKAWLDEGIPPVRLSVNVSALQFRASIALEADIAATLTQTGFPARLLELELTESVLMAASLEHGDFLERLRLRGVTVAIDDFGTGHSSLEYLRRFPSNRIKIARSFVTNLDNTPGDAAIVRATIGLARELEIDVIAEGVETQEQCDLLKKWGCGEVQGFHFARPLPTDGAANLLRAGKIPLMTNQLPPADGSNGTEPRARGSG